MLALRHKAPAPACGTGRLGPRVAQMFGRHWDGDRPNALIARGPPADARDCHFARAAWNGMVNAALMLGSLMERTEAGNDAILQSACAILATGHLRDISLRSD